MQIKNESMNGLLAKRINNKENPEGENEANLNVIFFSPIRQSSDNGKMTLTYFLSKDKYIKYVSIVKL